MKAAERSVRAAERAVLALEAIVGQTKGIIAELRSAIDGTGAPTGKRRKRPKVES